MAERAETGSAERTVLALARSFGGKVVSRRVLARTVELRLRFPPLEARTAVRQLVALPGAVRVEATPNGDTVVRVSRP
jgi:hypothetical protein